MRRIVITIEGGLITSVMSDADGIEVLLVDYDQYCSLSINFVIHSPPT